MANLRYIKPVQVKQLEDNVNSYIKKYYPNKPLRKFRDDNEAGLIKCIKAFVFLNGGQAERIDNRGYWVEEAKKYVPSMCEAGTADIHCTINGLSVKVEIKIGKDRQSEAQIKYQKRIEKAGGVYIIVRTFLDFYNWYVKMQKK